jgi:phytoene dehydrogenase-like protein
MPERRRSPSPLSHLVGSSVKVVMQTNWDVIVIGAGLAGLTAGATAAAGGARTVVLEAHERGGRARTVAKGRYVFNMGAHALYVGGPGVKILRSLGVEPDGVRPPFPRYKLVKDGRMHLMPSGPASLLRTTAMGAASKAQYARLLGLLPTLRPAKLARTSVDRWLADHNLRPDVEGVVRALIRLSTYTDDTAELSAEAAIRQLQIGARPGVLYLHGGWAQLDTGLAHHVQVETGCKVTALEPDTRGVVVRTAAADLTAGRVVVATGPPPARQAPEGRAVVQAIRYGATDADADRLSLDGHVCRIGVTAADVEQSRFLARMVVAGGTPLAAHGGLAGRPRVTDSGHAHIFIAGDWVGPEGLLADAAIASGHQAARGALASLDGAAALVA